MTQDAQRQSGSYTFRYQGRWVRLEANVVEKQMGGKKKVTTSTSLSIQVAVREDNEAQFTYLLQTDPEYDELKERMAGQVVAGKFD